MSSLWVRLGWGGGEQVMNSPYTLRVGNYVAPTHQPYLIGNPAGGTTNYAEPQDWGVLTYQRVAWQLLAGEQRLVTFQNVFRDGYPGCEEDQCERRAGASAAPGGCTALRSHSNSKHAEPTRLGGAIGDRRPDGGGAPHQRDAAIPCLIQLPFISLAPQVTAMVQDRYGNPRLGGDTVEIVFDALYFTEGDVDPVRHLGQEKKEDSFLFLSALATVLCHSTRVHALSIQNCHRLKAGDDICIPIRARAE